MLNSARRSISYPNLDRSDRPDIPAHIKNLVDALEIDVVFAQGTDAQRLAAAHLSGVIWRTSDTGKFWWDTGTIWVEFGAASYLTLAQFGALTPTDGMVVDLVLDSSTGTVVKMRYNASSASTYKWERIGGNDLYSFIAASEQVATLGSYQALTTPGPTITIPRNGDYWIWLGARFDVAFGAPNACFMSPNIGGAGASDSEGLKYTVVNAGGGGPSCDEAGRWLFKTGLTGGQSIAANYKLPAGSNTTYCNWVNRTMMLRPIRII
jgi:hypothetical protein